MILRTPHAPLLAAAPHLAALAVLEAALTVAAHALRAGLPAVDRGPFPGDAIELTTARSLVDDCDALLGALGDHRVHVLDRLRRCGIHPDWPY